MLPQFIILDGPPQQCRALADALTAAIPDISWQDFAEPAIEAMIALHYDGNWRHLNFEDPDQWHKFVPLTNYTIQDWLSLHRAWMRDKFGLNIMGRIFLDSYRQNNREDLYPCTIIRDFDGNYADIEPLLQFYDPARTMMVHIGPLRPTAPHSFGIPHHIWCPKDDVKDQLALVMRDIKSFVFSSPPTAA